MINPAQVTDSHRSALALAALAVRPEPTEADVLEPVLSLITGPLQIDATGMSADTRDVLDGYICQLEPVLAGLVSGFSSAVGRLAEHLTDLGQDPEAILREMVLRHAEG